MLFLSKYKEDKFSNVCNGATSSISFFVKFNDCNFPSFSIPFISRIALPDTSKLSNIGKLKIGFIFVMLFSLNVTPLRFPKLLSGEISLILFSLIIKSFIFSSALNAEIFSISLLANDKVSIVFIIRIGEISLILLFTIAISFRFFNPLNGEISSISLLLNFILSNFFKFSSGFKSCIG